MPNFNTEKQVDFEIENLEVQSRAGKIHTRLSKS